MQQLCTLQVSKYFEIKHPTFSERKSEIQYFKVDEDPYDK